MKRNFHGWSVGVLTVILVAVGTTGMEARAAADPIAPQLRAAVEKARSQLGQLQSWQEDAFQNEVLTSAGRFVKDYSSRGGVLTRVDVDFDGIKRYLGFHADQVLQGNRTAMLAVRATENCAPCVGAVPFVRKDLKERLERRGFNVVVLNAAESNRDLSEVLAKKSAVGWILAAVKNVEDPEHAGDFKNELLLEFRFPGTLLTRVQKQMEILPNDSVEVSLSRMAVDGITEIGNLVRQAKIGSLEAEGNEGVEIIVKGLVNFTQLQEMKKALQAQLQSSARVTERRLEQGSVTLSVVGDVKENDIARAVQGLQIPQLLLRVISSRAGAVEVTASPSGVSS